VSGTDPGRGPSGADPQDPSAIPVAEAWQRIEARLRPLPGRERLALRSALGRTLAEDVLSTVNVPAHRNSAMDGYALAAADLPAAGERGLEVVGTALAGRPFAGAVAPGQCVRIMTGAVMPEGTDTVVMQEQVGVDGSVARIGAGHHPGDNVRQAGEDLAAGQTALRAGRVLGPADLGLLASLGTAEVSVARRPRVAFLSTGDELRSVGQALGEGEVYDSNRYTLYGMLARLGVEPLDLGLVRDTPQALREALAEGAACADLVVTTAGVSVGEADFVRQVLAGLGEVSLWKVAIRPGRPLAFGRIGPAWFFGLPGNPVAVMVTFYAFVQPALRRLMGQTARHPARFPVPCMSRLNKRPGRTEYQRGRLRREPDGRLVVERTGQQGSGLLSSMSAADCFIVLPPEVGPVEPGTVVEVEPFYGLV
jgi:molybdopterin molybdotransferase